jgi:metallo-beta-lactamase class B
MHMKWHAIGLAALCFATALAGTSATGQSSDAAAAHQAAAKAAAGQEWAGLYSQLCSVADQPASPQRGQGAAARRGGRAAGTGRGAAPAIPDRAQWHHEPAKIFDNLYFVGMNDVAAWAVTTSRGIILIDALNDYAVEDEIVGGLTKLGLDPRQIKYVIVSHGHATHFGGAKFLQATYGARVGLTAADWDLIERTQGAQAKPKRDMIVTDGQKLTLGDTTITMYVTPGHTAGPISYLIPVKDKGKPHVVALSGISSATGAENLKTHIASAARFADIVGSAHADVMISDEDHFANYIKKIDAMTASHSGPGAFIVGNAAVKRYLTVVRECSSAILATL